MKRLNWKLVVSIPLGVAIAVSSIATWIDWSKNPGGMFHDSAGTNWTIVLETALSWFLPLLLVVAVGQAVWFFLINR